MAFAILERGKNSTNSKHSVVPTRLPEGLKTPRRPPRSLQSEGSSKGELPLPQEVIQKSPAFKVLNSCSRGTLRERERERERERQHKRTQGDANKDEWLLFQLIPH